MTCDESDKEADLDCDNTLSEQRILDDVAEVRGEEFIEKHAGLILAQARLVGEL